MNQNLLKSIATLKDASPILETYDKSTLIHIIEALIEEQFAEGSQKANTSAVIPPVKDFPELMKYLKREMQIPELDLFAVENNEVYLYHEGVKIPVKRNSSVKTPVPNQPVNKEEPPAPKEQNVFDEKSSRFKNLEMDL